MKAFTLDRLTCIKTAFIATAVMLLTVITTGAHCDTATVYFVSGQSRITRAQDEHLSKLLYRRSFAGPIRVLGYADEPGSDASNRRLAQKRADEVKGWLISSGIDSMQVVACSGLGNAAKSGEDARQRRVEIIECVETKAPAHAVSRIDSTLTHLRVNEVLTLKNIFFIDGMAEFRNESIAVVNELLDAMRQNPSLIIAIDGHVCCGRATDIGKSPGLTYGYEVSLARAKAVYQHLISNGIDSARVSYKGFGFSHPKVFPQYDEEDRIRNRRVEIRIIAK